MPSIARFVVGAALLGQAAAHTWIDQLSVVGSNGSFVGDYGYVRGYVARTDPGFDGFSNLWLLPALTAGRVRINDSDFICKDTQRTQNQTESWPRLSAAPGDYVAMKYSENGHVTLPNNQPGKPQKGGTVFIFGTAEPKDDEKMMDVLQWTTDGSGGDKRGKLLAVNNYDDGRCHQINSSPLSTQRQQEFPDTIPGQPGTHSELYCESNFQVPTDQATGKALTIYWVWEWPTAVGTEGLPLGKDEWYTACADVDVVESSKVKAYLAEGAEQKYPLVQQDPEPNAVSDYKSRTALTSTPVIFNSVGSTVAAAAGGATSGASSSAASTPASTPAGSSAKATSAKTASSTTAAAAASSHNNGADSGVVDGSMETVYITTTVQPPRTRSTTTVMVTVTASVPTVQHTTTTFIRDDGNAKRGDTTTDICTYYQQCMAMNSNNCDMYQKACDKAVGEANSSTTPSSTHKPTQSTLTACIQRPTESLSDAPTPSSVVLERSNGVASLRGLTSLTSCVAMVVLCAVAVMMG